MENLPSAEMVSNRGRHANACLNGVTSLQLVCDNNRRVPVSIERFCLQLFPNLVEVDLGDFLTSFRQYVYDPSAISEVAIISACCPKVERFTWKDSGCYFNANGAGLSNFNHLSSLVIDGAGFYSTMFSDSTYGSTAGHLYRAIFLLSPCRRLEHLSIKKCMWKGNTSGEWIPIPQEILIKMVRHPLYLALASKRPICRKRGHAQRGAPRFYLYQRLKLHVYRMI